MQHLKLFILGLVCLSAVSAKPMTDEEMAHMKAIKEKCIAKSGVDEAVVERSKTEPLDDKKLHCFGACVLQEMGMMSEAGEMQPEEAIKKIPDNVPHDKAEELINLCSKEKGDDPCATAAAVFTCLHENKAKEVFQMPNI